ncbi:PucR family transcriptional regulator [Streptomyces sp. NPDC048644]|uniref:PucR family transcriptional regulator n=1 Tax=Streptomyces sp. NPDC048644 TaxID=3365582 RepID=UPI0037169C69
MLRIADLLGHSALGLQAVGDTGGLNRAIRWVHVTELPDPGPYIGEDELVLTNGLWLAQQDPAVYVRGLIASRAAGLVYGLRTSTPVVPAELVSACCEARMPLLQLPVEVPFTAVTQVVSFADVSAHRLLLALLDRETRRGFAESVLGPVEEYDRSHRSELMRSLEVFLRSGMRWTETAGALHIHVNTLRNRLAKVRPLTGRDLSCTEDMVDVFLALQTYSEEE